VSAEILFMSYLGALKEQMMDDEEGIMLELHETKEWQRDEDVSGPYLLY